MRKGEALKCPIGWIDGQCRAVHKCVRQELCRADGATHDRVQHAPMAESTSSKPIRHTTRPLPLPIR